MMAGALAMTLVIAPVVSTAQEGRSVVSSIVAIPTTSPVAGLQLVMLLQQVYFHRNSGSMRGIAIAGALTHYYGIIYLCVTCLVERKFSNNRLASNRNNAAIVFVFRDVNFDKVPIQIYQIGIELLRRTWEKGKSNHFLT